MNAIHERLKIFCKDNEKEYELLYPNFTENDTEIKIKTHIKNSDLCRGWIGDLFYNTVGKDIYNLNNIISNDTVELCKDVLLAKVNISNTDGGIEWEYVFMKK